MRTDVKASLIAYLSENVEMAYGQVPKDRPERFITVELTGETALPWVSSSDVAVQAWGASDAEAAELSHEVVDAMWAFAREPRIRRVEMNGRYQFADPESGQDRYQLVYRITYK